MGTDEKQSGSEEREEMGEPCVHAVRRESMERKGARDRGGRWRHAEDSGPQTNVGVVSWNGMVPESPPPLVRGRDREFPVHTLVESTSASQLHMP